MITAAEYDPIVTRLTKFSDIHRIAMSFSFPSLAFDIDLSLKYREKYEM